MKKLSLANIRKAMIERNITSQKMLREKTGLSVSTVQRIFNDEAKPEANTVEALRQTLGLSTAQLFGEDAPPEQPASMDLTKEVFIEIKGKIWATPFRFSMGVGTGRWIKGRPGEQNYFAMEVEGDSMSPAYEPRDLIICKPHTVELRPYNEMDDAPAYVPIDRMIQYHNQDAIVEHEGQTTLKRLKIERKQGPKYEISMNSMNPKYAPVKLRFGEEWTIKALVVRRQPPEVPDV